MERTGKEKGMFSFSKCQFLSGARLLVLLSGLQSEVLSLTNMGHNRIPHELDIALKQGPGKGEAQLQYPRRDCRVGMWGCL